MLHFFKMPVSTAWIQGAYERKEKAALAIHKPKILLGAGSSVHFGLNAEAIGNAIKMPTINYGVMALLNVDYIFYRLKKVLKPADIVILPLEYDHYGWTSDAPYSEQRKFYLLTHDQTFFKTEVPLWQKIRTLYSLHPLLFISSCSEQRKATNKKPSPETGYRVSSINKFGDETDYNLHTLSSPGAILPSFPSKDFLQELESFKKWCDDRNIRLIFSFPNTAYSPLYDNPKYQQAFGEIINAVQKLHIPILGKPQDAQVDVQYIFDTNYHLTQKGIQIRTQRFIHLLKAMLAEKNIP